MVKNGLLPLTEVTQKWPLSAPGIPSSVPAEFESVKVLVCRACKPALVEGWRGALVLFLKPCGRNEAFENQDLTNRAAPKGSGRITLELGKTQALRNPEASTHNSPTHANHQTSKRLDRSSSEVASAAGVPRAGSDVGMWEIPRLLGFQSPQTPKPFKPFFFSGPSQPQTLALNLTWHAHPGSESMG